jgi:flagellar biosynthetic protein FlhB
VSDKSSKTEAPTPKRKKEAREKGQIAKTPELAAWTSVLVVSTLLQATIRTGAEQLTGLWSEIANVIQHPDTGAATRILADGMKAAVTVVTPLALGLMGIGVVLNLAQVGLKPSAKRMKPDFKRLNPFKGIKNMLSAKTAWETAKTFLKFAVLAAVGWPVLSSTAHQLVAQSGSLSSLLKIAGEGSITFVRDTAVAGLVIAAADYIVQRRRINSELRMTKQEVKDELRQSEGDPMLRQAIRSKQMAVSRNRMISAVAHSDVVLVNPTHYAIALKYEPDKGAPKVVAKGAGAVALGIRAQAERNGVPIVEDPPLTRTLFRACDLETHIPAELFEAVAKVLAFVFGLKRRGVRGGVHRPDVAAGAAI